MNEDVAPVTNEELRNWLMSLPLQERKAKIARLVKRLGVQRRAIEKWRQKTTILPKHYAGIREVMRGLDKINVPFEPHVYAALDAKAKQKGFKSVEEYLSDLTKGFLILALSGGVTWLALSEKTVGAQANVFGAFKAAKEWVAGLAAK